MGKLIKILLALFLAIVLIVIIGIAYIVYFVDPNSFKPYLIDQVKDQTGRTLTISGDLSWSFFPSIGIKTGDMTLSNPTGFGDKPFADITKTAIGVKLLPLFTGHIEPTDVVIDGLTLNLQEKSSGVNNWQDLSGDHKQANNSQTSNATPATSQPTQTQADKDKKAQEAKSAKQIVLPTFSIPNISIHDVNVSLTTPSQTIAIRDLELTTKGAKQNKPFDLTASFDFDNSNPKTTANIRLTSKVSFDVGDQQYNFNNTQLHTKMTTDALAQPVDSVVEGDIAVNLKKQTLDIKNLLLSLNKVRMQGQLSGKNIMSAPELIGQVKLDNSNIQTLMALSKTNTYQPTDSKALTNVSGSINFDIKPNSAKFAPIALKLDSSNITGTFDVTDINQQKVNFALNLDQINLDNYMPKATAAQTSQSKADAAINAYAPQDHGQASTSTSDRHTLSLISPEVMIALRKPQVSGTLKAGSLIVNKLKLTTFNASIKSTGGKWQLNPLSFNLYQGSFKGDATLDVSGQDMVVSTNNILDTVHLSPLLKDMMGTASITGTAHFQSNLTTHGLTEQNLRQNLNGNMQFAIKDGALEGVDLVYYTKAGLNLLKGKGSPSGKPGKETSFGNLTGSAVITNGIARNNDLVLDSDSFDITGQGTINLINDTLDYALKVKADNDDSGISVPLKLSGNLASPKVSVDQSGAVEVIGDTLNKQLGDKVNDALKDKGKDLLKGFGF